MPMINAIRQTSLSIAALEEVVTAPHVLVIRSHGGEKTNIRKLLTRLVAFLGLDS